jgi:ankyrin repeat protein
MNNNIINIINNVIYKKNDIAIRQIETITKEEIQNYRNNNEETLLMICCYIKNSEIVEKIIEKVDDEYINRVSKYNISALGIACDKNMEEIAIKLYKRADDRIKNIGGVNKSINKTILYLASKKNMKNLVREIIEDGKIKDEVYNYITEDGYSIIYWMYYHKMTEEIEKIKEKIKTETINTITKDEKTILMLVKNNKKEIKEMIERVDDKVINKTDKRGLTIFDYTIRGRNSKMTERIKQKVKPTFNNMKIICNSRKKKLMREYIDRITEEEINRVDDKNRTILHYACMKNMEKEAIKIIEYMTDENIKRIDSSNNSILYYACKNKMEEFIKEVINRMDREIIKRECEKEDNIIEICKNRDMIEIEYIINKKIS